MTTTTGMVSGGGGAGVSTARGLAWAAGLAVALVTGAAGPAWGTDANDITPAPMMMRFPAVSADKICFVYANDLWLAPKTGGVATPLSTREGAEVMPRFSPDGKTIAFAASYEGNREIYTLPVAGGEAFRVTHHPAGESPIGWTPDGKNILFITNGFHGLGRVSQIWQSPAAGGMMTQLPVPYGAFGSISGDGTWLAYTLHSIDTRTWKRYRGGMATDVWLFNLKDKTSRRMTDWEGTDTLPMWHKNVVYYLSDQGPEHRLNVWSFDPASGERTQITTFKDDDVRWPSMGPGSNGEGEIVFQLGGGLRLLNLGNKRVSEVKVTIPGDRPSIRERTVDASEWLVGASISPTGKRVIASARGDLWSLPGKEGAPRNMSRTVGVFERDPSWSPDGRLVAYFSDESGEYELYVRGSGARVTAEEKKGEKKGEDAEKAEEGTVTADAAARKLTSLGAGFRSNINWSPDSAYVTFNDQNGRLLLTKVADGETKEIDKDPWMTTPQVSWSHDSTYVAYTRTDERTRNGTIWFYNVISGEKTRVTDPMFSASSPAFDRAGDWVLFASQRAINDPTYSDLDTTFIYRDTEVLLMAPLRKDVKSPWLTKSDEEEIKPEKAGEKQDGEKPAEMAPVPDDGVSGTWEMTITGDPQTIPGGQIPVILNLRIAADGKISGTVTAVIGSGTITGGSWNKETGELQLTVAAGGATAQFTLKVSGTNVEGTWAVGQMGGKVTGSRTAGPAAEKKAEEPKDEKKDEKKDGEGEKKKEDKKPLKIDFDGLEARAMQLPVAAGGFGQTASTHDNKWIYVRISSRGDGASGIRIFDPKDEGREEKSVSAGGGFDISGDGKKLLVWRGGSNLSIVDASAGGRSQTVPTGGMRQTVRPREEWRQIVTDSWRIFRDWFYEPTMHGVDWAKVKQHYMGTLEDAASREDVQFIIGEMISELNVGHAYVQAPGDVEDVPTTNVGLLGADFELVTENGVSAYRIAKIIAGGPWDSDARSPLATPGVDVKAGQFVLAVNGTPIDTSKDVYAAFIGTAERPTAITVSDKPTLDASAREVIVRPVGSESSIRYRAWIEAKRQYVLEKSGGRIGYIYVPNTGLDGQSDLFRQFVGQRGMDALIIDDRWNGGGQIPTRFIELLNRPRTNYWARRDGKDWASPEDSHQGPKAMLINGLAGSGGDMFPWLFRFNNLGKLIGTRTWGGLVGISGNPGLIDGGSIAVPSFGFYEKDGTWGVEGHGVDPDIEVLDDPAKMQNGADPQIDAAVAQLLEELKTKPYVPPQRPASPNRAGMGLPASDK